MFLGGSLSFGLDDDNGGGEDFSSDSLSAFFAGGGEWLIWYSYSSLGKLPLKSKT